MWDDDEDGSPAEAAADRAIIGTMYLLLIGIVLSGVVQLVAQS